MLLLLQIRAYKTALSTTHSLKDLEHLTLNTEGAKLHKDMQSALLCIKAKKQRIEVFFVFVFFLAKNSGFFRSSMQAPLFSGLGIFKCIRMTPGVTSFLKFKKTKFTLLIYCNILQYVPYS